MQSLYVSSLCNDSFPFFHFSSYLVKYIPGWFPGAGFKRKAKLWGKGVHDSFEIPFEEVSKSFSKGKATPSFVTSWLSRLISGFNEDDKQKLLIRIKNVSGTSFLAAVETTTSTLLNFVFLMITHPDVQRKAQEELDEVVGRNRLPDPDDKESLPYMRALIKEVLRIYPILPFAIPHRLIADDVYNGMFIPKGTIVSPNVWAMSRDMRDYAPDPEVFRPERYLEANLRDPSQFVFGFGRRICPGRYMAENTLFIAISAILHLFSITRMVDEDGSGVPFEPRWVNGVTVHLAPFPASFQLRFEGAEKMIDSGD